MSVSTSFPDQPEDDDLEYEDVGDDEGFETEAEAAESTAFFDDQPKDDGRGFPEGEVHEYVDVDSEPEVGSAEAAEPVSAPPIPTPVIDNDAIRERLLAKLRNQEPPPKYQRGDDSAAHLERIAEYVIPILLDGDPVKLLDIAHHLGHKTANAVGTILGGGIKSSGGPRCRKVNGYLTPCGWNVAQLFGCMSLDKQRSLIADIPDFTAKLAKLPPQ